jgi:hypothetical protein
LSKNEGRGKKKMKEEGRRKREEGRGKRRKEGYLRLENWKIWRLV